MEVQQTLNNGPIGSKMNDQIKREQQSASGSAEGSPFDNADTNFTFGPSGFDSGMPDLSAGPDEIPVPF